MEVNPTADGVHTKVRVACVAPFRLGGWKNGREKKGGEKKEKPSPRLLELYLWVVCVGYSLTCHFGRHVRTPVAVSVG